jgi:hypothetical protein
MDNTMLMKRLEALEKLVYSLHSDLDDHYDRLVSVEYQVEELGDNLGKQSVAVAGD